MNDWEIEIKKCFLTERMTDWPVPTVRINPDTLLSIVQSQLAKAKEEARLSLLTELKEEIEKLKLPDYMDDDYGNGHLTALVKVLDLLTKKQ